jgi:AcrR family transcriptional regulator
MAHVINSRSRTPKTRRNPKKPASQTRSAQIRTATRRRSPKQTRSQTTAQAILTAAEQLLVEVGFARASTNAIARRAGVSVGSLYQYYPNKDAVFRAVVERHSRNVKPVVMSALDALAAPRSNIVAVTLDLLRQLAIVNAKNPPLLLAIERELGAIGHDAEAAMNVEVPIRSILAKRYTLPDAELDVIVSLMVETVSHLSRWLIHSKPQGFDTERFLGATARMLKALLPGRRAQTRSRSNLLPT